MKEQLVKLTDELETAEAHQALEQSLQSENLLPTEVVLGGGSLKKRLAEIPDKRFDEPAALRVVSRTQANLETMYHQHNRRLNLAFFASLICGCATVVFVIWATWFSITSGVKVDVKIFGAVASSLLTGGCLWLYRSEAEKIRPIEKDLQKLQKFHR